MQAGKKAKQPIRQFNLAALGIFLASILAIELVLLIGSPPSTDTHKVNSKPSTNTD